ncbi:transcriptional regulator [Shewanella sp. OPT22]|uniref:metalloregulator ArsR/SmtB family transcription factor n=1 Tax=Parashewanella hymeniacidonis TaxID=2807618 RepID=UPI00102134CE|nr:metalloregulator ArsR/SmtB family transcription factor [Parashewanella hymeniacidonis]MBM7071459.1 metalloregulator ArsR/SmtB family transcription factor [Parashewanella hymeniacidonis]RYV03507.1 transcriptional regulator [Shewanella sp. OPT22]
MDSLSLFKALSDQTRLTSVVLIHSQQELCVCELMVGLDEIQPKVSRHLALLKKQGVLCGRKQGQWVFYFLNPELPAWFIQMLDQLVLEPQNYQAALDRLNKMGDRPLRQTQCC